MVRRLRVVTGFVLIALVATSASANTGSSAVSGARSLASTLELITDQGITSPRALGQILGKLEAKRSVQALLDGVRSGSVSPSAQAVIDGNPALKSLLDAAAARPRASLLTLYRSGAASPATTVSTACPQPVPNSLANVAAASNASNLLPSGRRITDEMRINALATGNNSFGADLYGRLATGDANAFFSPYSIRSALGMTSAGAGGSTLKGMEDALDLLPQSQLHKAFAATEKALESRGATADEPFTLKVANALWGNQNVTFKPEFVTTLEENYGAGLTPVDFSNKTAAAKRINDWASDNTAGKIPTIVKPADLDASTPAVLTNAAYFKAAWATQFKPAATEAAPFKKIDGSSVTAQMMHQKARHNYVGTADYQAIELPYDGGDASMIVIAPMEGKLGDFEAGLTADKLADISGSMTAQQVSLGLPKFKVETEYHLKPQLGAMGMSEALKGTADFSGATDANFYIGDVIHKGFIEVNEEGTEAAAVTAVVTRTTSMPPRSSIEMTVDRPFVYAIRDNKSGNILFMGRVTDPS